jgi:hypothetical protein
MSVKKAHDMLGHINEKAVRKTAITLGWELTRGTLGVCEPCTETKAKHKNLPRYLDTPPFTKDESRIYLDIATIKKTKKGPKVYKDNWRIMVDERTQLKFSDFFDTKNGMVEETCEQLRRWKESGRGADIIRLDNAGENKLLQQRSQSADWKLNVNFEFTARDTPQQNHLAELGFAHLANYGRALMARANVPLNIRYKVFTKAFKTATLLDELTVIKIGNKEATRYEHWCGKNPDFSEYLRTWGEVGTVKIKANSTPKIGDRGIQCMLVGYSFDHTADCYEMWDPATSRVHQTRDVIWLNQMYYNREEPAVNIVIEPDMEPVIVYHTDNPVINGSGEGDNDSQPTVDDNNNIDDDEDSGIHHLPDEFFDAKTEQIGNTSYEIDIPTTSTRAGRISRPPPRLIETATMAQEMNNKAADYKCELMPAED